MTWVDAIVLLILAISALFAFLRGFIREALGLCAWAGAVYVAIAFFGPAQAEARRLIANTEIADPAAFIAVFLAALIAFSILASLIAGSLRNAGLGGLDRTIGLLFGLLRGAAIVCATYIAVSYILPVLQWPDVVLKSRSLPYAYAGANWIVAQLPPRYAPKVDAPPGLPPGAGALLQSAPRGFALGHHAPATAAGPGDEEIK